MVGRISDLWRRLKRERPAIKQVAHLLSRTGIHPNVVTLTGFLLSLIPPLFYASGRPVLGAVLLLFTSVFDSIDGTLARMSGRETRFGAFLDSSLDRFSEFALFLGIAYYFRGEPLNLFLTLIAMFGSFMVSYTRARAEGLDEAVARGEDSRMKVGPMDRTLRILYIFFMSFLWKYYPLLISIYIVLVYVTVLRRMYGFFKVDSGKAG